MAVDLVVVILEDSLRKILLALDQMALTVGMVLKL